MATKPVTPLAVQFAAAPARNPAHTPQPSPPKPPPAPPQIEAHGDERPDYTHKGSTDGRFLGRWRREQELVNPLREPGPLVRAPVRNWSSTGNA